MERKEIKRSEFTELRNEKNYTIKHLAEYYSITEEKVRRIMKQLGLSTKLKGRKRELGITLIDDITNGLENAQVYTTVNQ